MPTSGTPNPQLQNDLNNLQTALNNLGTQTGVTSYYQTYYQEVYNSITQSPQLLAQFNAQAASGAFTGFVIGTGGSIQFNPTTGTVQLPANMITTLVNNNYASLSSIQNDFTNTLGHEIYHDSYNTTEQQQIDALNTSLHQTINSWDNTDPIDLTSYVQSYVQSYLANEANADIQGWNDEISMGVAANGGNPLSMSQIASLIGTSGHASQLFNVTQTAAQGVPVTQSGITMDESGSVDATTSNVAAAGQFMSQLSPSNDPSVTYAQYYAASAVGQICTDISGLPFQYAINYSQLGLTTSPSGAALTDQQVDNALISAAAASIGSLPLGSGGSCTITNSADDATNTFSQGPSGVTSNTTTAPSPLIDSSPAGPEAPPPTPIDGTLGTGQWEVATNQPANGAATTSIFGVGAILNTSGEVLTAESNVTATVDGSNNTIAAGSGDSLGVQGTNDTVTSSGNLVNLNGNGTQLTIFGSGNTSYLYGTGQSLTTSSGTINLVGNDTNEGIVGNGVTVNTASGDTLGVQGTNDLVNSSNNLVNLNGNGTQLTIAGSGNTSNLLGTGQSVTASSGTINLVGNDTNESIVGNGLAVNTTSGDTLGIQGSADTVNANDAEVNLNPTPFTKLGGPQTQVTINGTGDSSWLYGTADLLTEDGSSNTVYAESSNLIRFTGTSELATATSDRVEVTSNTTVTVDGKDDTFVASGGGDQIIDNLTGGGSEVFDWSSNGSESIVDYTGYNGTGSVDGSSGGYYGYYGVSGKRGEAAISGGTDIGLIAQYDQQQGDLAGADAAQVGWDQAFRSSLSTNQQPGIGAAAISGQHWSQKVITWSLAQSAASGGTPFSGYMTSAYATQVQAAFNAWAAAMPGVSFVQVADSSQSDIRIGWANFATATTGVVGYTSYHAQAGQIAAGAVIQLEDPSQDAFTGSGQTYGGTQATLDQALLHEIGHALGLGDSSDPNSVMYYDLTSSNTTLDSTDTAGIGEIYGSETPSAAQNTIAVGTSVPDVRNLSVLSRTAASGVDQLVQALATLSPQSSASISDLTSEGPTGGGVQLTGPRSVLRAHGSLAAHPF